MPHGVLPEWVTPQARSEAWRFDRRSTGGVPLIRSPRHGVPPPLHRVALPTAAGSSSAGPTSP
jgi:hypothetical protein